MGDIRLEHVTIEATTGEEGIKKNCKIMRKLRFEEITKENIKIAAKTQNEIFPTSSAEDGII